MKLFVFLALFFILDATAQDKPERIFWEETKLTWNDFKAKPNSDSPFQANTNAGLSYSWGLRNENGKIELKYEVLSFFNPNSSWVVPRSKSSEYLLQHEQLHFDITELHARKLRKQLAELKIDQLGKDPKSTLNKLYEVIEKERAAMQLKYDKESNHSLNKEGEAKWQNFVKKELKKFENFNS